MIVSASRRTDIPAFFPQKFLTDYRKGYTTCQTGKTIKTINFSDADCIVFWTKDFSRLTPHIGEIHTPFYIQYTINSYGKDIEPLVPEKNSVIQDFKHLSSQLGKERLIWRYDPIFISSKYTISYHMANFARMARSLNGYTERCVISIVDFYGKVAERTSKLGIRVPTIDETNELLGFIAQTAAKYNIEVQTCAEKGDYSRFSITPTHCVDAQLIERITGKSLGLAKDPTQRKECGCVISTDIGTYNTCKHGCKYCYACK